MKIAFAWCVLGFLALSNVTISRAEGSSGDIEKAVTALEKQWTQAETANNADLIAPLLADKFIVTESEGQVIDRAAFLAEERSSQYSSSEIDDLKISVFGDDTAIARYVLRQKYTSKGKAFDIHVRETDTWVKMPNGAWQCVASHASKIKHT
jgi:ketosteroid isomerase-like protein